MMPGPGPQYPRLALHRRWPVVAVAWVAVLSLLGLWLLGTSDNWRRQRLEVLQFWWLEATVFAGLALGAVIVRDITRLLTRRDLAAMAGLAVLAAALTLGVAPRTNRIYYDEQIYQGIGQNLSDQRRARMCNDGTVEYGRLQCWAGEYNKQPYAYPHLLSLAYRAFGATERAAFVVNAAAMVLSVIVVYLLGLVLFGDATAAFFSGLVLSLTPHQLLWSATAAVEPTASLACAAALLAAAHFVRARSTASLAAAVAACAYATQFRPESVLMLLPIAWLLWDNAREEFARPRMWWAALLGLALVALHLVHLYSVRNESWGTSDARLSLRYVTDNLSVNGMFYLGDERFPVVFTALALVGLLARRSAGQRGPLALYFLVFFGIDLLFYAGSYNYGADVRYSLMTYPPLAVMAGLGVSALIGRLRSVRPEAPAHAAAAAALGFQFLWYMPLVRATTEEAWAARADVRFAREVAGQLPSNAYVLTHNPAMFHLWGINAGQMSIVLANPSHIEYLGRRYPGGVFLHWNFWCNVTDQSQRNLCRDVMAVKPVEPIREYVERDQRFAFYRYRVGAVGQPHESAGIGTDEIPIVGAPGTLSP
jgi:hypothetical protein